MNIYHITHKDVFVTYEAAIVAALDEETARLMYPDARGDDWPVVKREDWRPVEMLGYLWCSSPDEVTVKLLGVAVEGIEQGVIMALPFSEH